MVSTTEPVTARTHAPGPAPAPPAQGRGGNLTRNAYHVANAAGVILLVELILPDLRARIAVAAAAALAAWTMEASRRWSPAINGALMALFARVAHPDEAARVNSATWYTTAILVLAVAFPLDAAVAALAVLGVGDPVAAIVGGRYGRTRLAQGRSLEGTAAFVVAAFGAAYAVLAVWHVDRAGPAAVIALAAAVAGALGELCARRLDDNLVIPLAAAAAAVGARIALGGV